MASESQDPASPASSAVQPSGVTSEGGGGGGPASLEDCEDPFLSCDELEEFTYFILG